MRPDGECVRHRASGREEGGASGARNGQKGPNIGIHMTAVSTGFYRWVEDKGRK